MTALDDAHREDAPRNEDVDSDLGFGAFVARESRQRLLNRDGTFNVRRQGSTFWDSISLYHYLLTITWASFLAYLAAAYLLTNGLFAAAFVACGPDALTGVERGSEAGRFASAFFFSVHTLATIGYGSIAPNNFAANIVVAVEALIGLLAFALIAGIVFARFARPKAHIKFSRHALVAPYRDETAFMFRIANQRTNEIVQLEARVMLTRRRPGGGSNEREFLALKLERDRVTFFPLAWTIVHPIDPSSPLYGMTLEKLQESESEFLILLKGFDETFSQTVHARSSYTATEVVWGSRFASVFVPRDDGQIGIDIRRLHEIETVDEERGTRNTEHGTRNKGRAR